MESENSKLSFQIKNATTKFQELLKKKKETKEEVAETKMKLANWYVCTIVNMLYY